MNILKPRNNRLSLHYGTSKTIHVRQHAEQQGHVRDQFQHRAGHRADKPAIGKGRAGGGRQHTEVKRWRARVQERHRDHDGRRAVGIIQRSIFILI